MKNNSIKKYVAECIGTFILVFIGCGTAMITGAELVATALAFGLAIVVIAYSIGNISGGHVNPAVSFAFLLKGELSITDFIGYIAAQFAGAFAATGFLAFIFGTGLVTDLTGIAYADTPEYFKDASADTLAFIKEHGLSHHLNGFGANAMTNVGGNHFTGFVVEILLTFIFVLAIIGVTSKKAKHGSFGGLIIGLSLTGVHLLGITMFAMFGGNFDPIAGLWAFLLGPMIGAALAVLAYKFIESDNRNFIK